MATFASVISGFEYLWFVFLLTFMLAWVLSAFVVFGLSGRTAGSPGLLLTFLFLLWSALFLVWAWLFVGFGEQWNRILLLVWDGLGIVVLTVFTAMSFGRVPPVLVAGMLACHVCDLTLVATLEAGSSDNKQTSFFDKIQTDSDVGVSNGRINEAVLGGYLLLEIPLRATFGLAAVFFYTLIHVLAQRMGDIRNTFGLVAYFVLLHGLIYMPLVWCFRSNVFDTDQAKNGVAGALLAFDAVLLVIIHPILNFMGQEGRYGHLLSSLCMGFNFIDLLMWALLLSAANR